MATALIGHSGFVGGNLLRQRRFDELYNSKNIADIAGRRFDLVVCAGAPAEKWKANKDPAGDLLALAKLSEPLRRAKIRKLVLISTVDVYGDPIGKTEADEPAGATAYGANRLELERTLAAAFPTLVVRLPGLFGDGLKKNAIYDLMHDNQVEKIDSRGVFQFYGLDTLWRDVLTAEMADLKVVNFVTPPVSVAEIASVAFGREFRNEVVQTPARYDLRTRHSDVFGADGGYVSNRDVLAGIRAFVARQQQVRKCA